MAFQKATKYRRCLRLALVGPAGSGKSFTALKVATALGGPIAVIDSERGSARDYADLYDFDVDELNNFDPRNYIQSIKEADSSGYNVLIIDGLSQAWNGKGGALELKDVATKRNNGNSYTAWRDVTPLHNELIDVILACKCHVICTVRSKMEYVQEKLDNGKTVIRKVGMAPIQRDGLEYEFSIVGDMTIEHDLIISKSRCSAVEGQVYNRPGEDFIIPVVEWLNSGDTPQPYVILGANSTGSDEKQDLLTQELDKMREAGGNASMKNKNTPAMSSAKQQQLAHILGAQKFGKLKSNPQCTEQFKQFVADHYGVTSTKELTSIQVSELIENLEKLPDFKVKEKPEPEPEQVPEQEQVENTAEEQVEVA